MALFGPIGADVRQWQIKGDTDSISRVIVLGAARIGPTAAGVVGIPADRVHFTSPNLTALDTVPKTSCTRIFNACTASQWFGAKPGDHVAFHPTSKQPRQQLNAIAPSKDGRRRNQDNPVTIIYPAIADEVVTIDPASVVSPQPAQPYTVLPGRPGLRALVDSGALAPSGSDIHRIVTANYAEAFSARYRSRFDPEFMFTPTVNYVVTRAITLPAELPRATFMVADGVPAPDMNENSDSKVCLYFEDQASKPITRRDHRSVLCRQQMLGIPDQDRGVLYAALSFDTSGKGVNCQLASIPDNTHIAVVALSQGPYPRYHDDPIRQIDVEVTRDGPVALHLSVSEGGPVRWNLTGPDIVAVYMDEGTKYGMHRVVMNGEPYEQIPLRNKGEDCPRNSPSFPSGLGPAIAQLDQMFATLTGHRIDQMITLTDKGTTLFNSGALIPRYVVE